LEYFCN